jgi:hypothetical protein
VWYAWFDMSGYKQKTGIYIGLIGRALACHGFKLRCGCVQACAEALTHKDLARLQPALKRVTGCYNHRPTCRCRWLPYEYGLY